MGSAASWVRRFPHGPHRSTPLHTDAVPNLRLILTRLPPSVVYIAALIAVADRLRSGLRGTDLAARLGGDEFGVLLRDLPGEGRAIEVAERLLATLNEPLVVADVSVTVGASIGIAIDSPQMRTVDDLLSDADIAMYRAKALGKGRYHAFRDTDPAVRPVLDQDWVKRGRTVRRRDPLRLAEPRLEPRAG